jgi:hypothetical protein
MPLYMYQAAYTPESLAAQIREPADRFEVVASSEAEHGHRNAALAHFLASYGNLENPVGRVLDHYVRHCAIAMSCAELALAGGFLARHGVRRDGSLVSRSDAKRINAVMLACGTYDAAGEFAYRVGRPAQSGVAGGIPRSLRGAAACACGARVWTTRATPSRDRGSRCVHDPDRLVGVLVDAVAVRVRDRSPFDAAAVSAFRTTLLP